MTDKVKVLLDSPVRRFQIQLVDEPMLSEASRTYYEDYSLRPRNRPTDMAKCYMHEMVLFANLLSKQEGLEPCYFYDEELTVPITPANASIYVYCNFDANGWRLPTVIEAKRYVSKGWLRRIWLQCWFGISFRAGDDRKGHTREPDDMEHFCLVRLTEEG